MAPPKKPTDRRQRRNDVDVGLVLVDQPPAIADEVEIPKPPTRLLKATREAWEQFWRSESAALVRDSHRPALYRLFGWYDRQLRAWQSADRFRRDARAEPYIAGSKGQRVLNPMFRAGEEEVAEARRIEAKIVALEDRFGLSPLAELRLGVTFQRRQSLEAMNRKLWQEGGQGPDDEPDPRALPRAAPGNPAAPAP